MTSPPPPVPPPTTSYPRVEILDPLRGFAALAVAWFHFTQGNSVAQGWLKATGHYGWLGVEMFFVISGFIIPYSMHCGGYQVGRHFGRFLLKRLTRLEPPYLVSIAVVVALWYLSAAMPGFRGEQPNIQPTQLLLHLGYLNAFFGYPWLNPVYWTLGIELQYYLLVAVVYPMLASRRPWLHISTVLTLLGFALLVESPVIVCHYLGLFVLGILAFQYHGRVIEVWTYLLGTVIASGVMWLTQGPEVAIVGLVTGLAIAFVRLPRNRLVRGFAPFRTRSISYTFRSAAGFAIWEAGMRGHSPSKCLS
jgi:peptidoglycan/LPS O-acetylase OafA/YrhL